MPKLQPYTKDWLQELCLNIYSLAEVLKKAGRKQGGGSQATLKKKIEEYQIDISHFTGQTWNKGKTSSDDSRIKATRKIDNEKILCENSLVSRSVLRRRIIAENLLEYKCSSCNNTGEWLNQPLSLQLDHINGINNDNRLENLRWLCPNCHSQTDTFAGKNIDMAEQLDKDYITAQLKNYPSARQLLIGLGYAVNGNNLYKVKYFAALAGIKEY